MKFKHPNRSFVAFVVIFVLVIVIGLLTINKPDLKYKLSIDESVEQLMANEDKIYPEDLVGIIEMEEPGYVLIDLRNPYEFIKGHIAGAINIPTNSILSKDKLKMFNRYAADSTVVVLYGQTQLEANGPWMILKQMGYDNMKVLLGGYHYFTTGPLDFYDMPEIPEYLVEEPAYDYYGIMEAMGSKSGEDAGAVGQPQIVIPVRKKKESVVEGGC
ncbi:MAG: rhodanese-like domain-containing protein [Bacteroidales bacterium]|nr:rhodanese-like domain-containing protein [Bacteroidales bacterium]